MQTEDFSLIPPEEINSVLDAGCGIGLNLGMAAEHFNAHRGVGVEPSAEAVALLTERYATQRDLEFTQGVLHQLPFETDTFDLVICWSVLHWVGRDEYLQSIGELIRVARRYILVMDFFAAKDYRVPYQHREGLFTYKQDFQRIFEASGSTQTLNQRYWRDQGDGKTRSGLDPDDFTPFLGNIVNYEGRKSCLFEKSSGVLPILTEANFR